MQTTLKNIFHYKWIFIWIFVFCVDLKRSSVCKCISCRNRNSKFAFFFILNERCCFTCDAILFSLHIFVQHTPCRRCQTKCRLVEKYWICRKQQSNVSMSMCIYCSLFSHPLSANFWICDEQSMKQHQMHITSHMRIDINLQNWMKCKFFILNGIFYLSSMFFDSIFPIPYSI